MNLETPEPRRLSRLSSFLSFLFVSSTLNPFHQPPPPPSNNPTQKSPESTLEQSDSDISMKPHCPESESIETNKHELAFLTTSSHPHQVSFSSASSASSSEITCGEENTRSSSSPSQSQVNYGISTTRVSYPCPNSLNTNPQISHSAAEENRDELLPETASGRRNCLLRVLTDASIPSYPWPSSSAIFSREDGTISSFLSKHSFPKSETTNRRSSDKFLRVMEIMDQQDLAKHLLGLAIPTGVGLVFSANAHVKTTEMHIVAIALSLAIAFIWNGLLLRKTYSKSSTFILMLGAALMMLSFYSLVGCFLPLYLKWIPPLCWLASLIPFAMYACAYFQRDKIRDPCLLINCQSQKETKNSQRPDSHVDKCGSTKI